MSVQVRVEVGSFVDDWTRFFSTSDRINLTVSDNRNEDDLPFVSKDGTAEVSRIHMKTPDDQPRLMTNNPIHREDWTYMRRHSLRTSISTRKISRVLS